MDQLLKDYTDSTDRLILLDYDGVLVPIVDRPEFASPDEEVLSLLKKLSDNAATKVVIVSGRDLETLEKWLGTVPVDMSAEHGHFRKEQGKWQGDAGLDMSWSESVHDVMLQLVDENPGSHIETKHASLVWHYRETGVAVDELAAEQRVRQAVDDRAIVMPGKRVIDVRAKGADKGSAARHWYEASAWDFVLCIGDDVTDEAMFGALPDDAWTLKVGPGPTSARSRLEGHEEVIQLLRTLTELK